MRDAPTSQNANPTGVPLRLGLLAALALAGTGVSVYLTQHYYEVRNGSAGFKSICNLSSTMNCDAVAASKFADFLPGLPLSSFAAGWFIALFVIALIARGAFWRREGLRAALVLSAFGTLMSLFYLVVMATVLKTYCLFCLAADAISVSSFLVVLSLKPEGLAKIKLDASKWRTFAGITGAALIVALLGLRGLDNSERNRSEEQDAIRAVLASPVLSVNSSAEFPSIGPADAPITIVEYSDFQCPYCRLGAFELNTVVSRYPTQVRVVMRNFPFDQACNRKVERLMHAHACEAAKAALCAHKQGKFVAAYEALFQNQDNVTAGTPGVANKIVLDTGIDAQKFNECIGSADAAAAVSRDIEEAINLGVNSTPTFFINGHRIEGGKPPAVWSQIIDEMLKAGGK